MSKRILFLGAGLEQMPAIKYAKDQGYYVITCDYLPDNPGHIYSDEYYDISTIDKDAVLNLAKKLKVNAVLSFGTDSNIFTQAYVEKNLGFVSNKEESLLTLIRKDLLKTFFKKHKFYSPKSNIFDNYNELINNINTYKFPIIIKPVDGSCSNGVSKVSSLKELYNAFEYAIKFSKIKKIIIEELFEFDGNIITGDGLIADEKLIFYCWGDALRSNLINPLVQMCTTFPSKISDKKADIAKNEIERLFRLLNIKNSPFNIEFGFDKNENLFIMDITPRNGGFSIPNAIKYATGIDLVKYAVDSLLGNKYIIDDNIKVKNYISEFIVPSYMDGEFSDFSFSDEILNNILEKRITVKAGDKVKKMNIGTDRLGYIYLKFDSSEEMHDKMNNIDKHIKVIYKS